MSEKVLSRCLTCEECLDELKANLPKERARLEVHRVSLSPTRSEGGEDRTTEEPERDSES